MKTSTYIFATPPRKRKKERLFEGIFFENDEPILTYSDLGSVLARFLPSFRSEIWVSDSGWIPAFQSQQNRQNLRLGLFKKVLYRRAPKSDVF